MLRYTINRILYLIPVLLILSVSVFVFVNLLPGNVIDIIMSGEENISDPAVRKALEKELGLDKPIYVRYFIWLNRVLHGNFGKSMVTRRPVSLELFERIPATIYLALVGVVLSLIIAVPLGTIAAV
jgi:ABC-type dipeptide/oligopeptide/nickel transport system permease component